MRIEKVTVNIGVGNAGEKLEKAKKLLEKLTGQKPVETTTKCRIPAWNLRPGLAIGTKVTLRGKKAEEFLAKCLESVNKTLKLQSMDRHGNVAFGVREYIDMPGVKYDPEIGMFGFDVCVTVGEPGYRTARRKRRPCAIPDRHRPDKEAVREYFKKKFNANFGEQE